MKNKMFSLFIPCYNEESCLEKNIKKIHSVLENYQKRDKDFQFEIIIVNDCSTDKTGEIADKLSLIKEIRAIHYHGLKPTRRENLIRSFKYAKGEIIGLTDADLSTDITDFPILYNAVEDEKTIVIGDRYHKDSKIKRSFKRLIFSKTLNFLTRILFSERCRDHFCGFKAFSKKAILHILEYTGIGNKQRSMWWDAEMLIYAQRLGYKIKPIPIKWVEGRVTTLRIKREIGILIYMLKFWYKLKWTKSINPGSKES